MNATKRLAAGTALVLCSAFAVALTGCRTDVVHERTRTVYVPAPPPVVYAPPAPTPQPPPTVVVVPPPEQSPVVVIQSENDFYEPLAAHGRWVVVGSYGRCWIPARVEAGWRPYANGYWQRTDAGWYWASEEPWGWATYHYGRWDFHADYGWIWVPQTQWAPAWVSWREGGGYVGWAPLRPSVSMNVSIGTAVREPVFESRAFVFVEHRRMLEPVRPKTVVVNNTTIINQTVNITKVTVVNKTVINEGPRPEVIERESGRKVQAVPVHEFRRREEASVAARQRNIPTASERKVQPPARTGPQPAPKQAVLPRNAHVVEKSVGPVTQPSRPPTSAPPIREAVKPQPAERRVQPDAGRLTREERKGETDTGKNVKSVSPAVETKAKPEVKPEQAVPPRRDIQPVEKPTVTANPTPPPVTTNPVRETVKQPPGRTPAQPATVQPAGGRSPRDERNREAENARKVESTPPTIERKVINEAKPEPARETNPPVRTETAPRAAVKKQAAPPAQNPAEKKLMSPREKSRAAEHIEANKKTKEAKDSKKGDEQETPTPATNSTRQPR